MNRFYAARRSGGFPRVAVLILLALCASVPRGSRAAENYDGGILDIGEVLKASAGVTRERFPNADDVLVDDFIKAVYQADGTGITWDDTFVKVLTEKGKRDNNTLSRHFTLPYGTAAFTVVQVIKPDGTVVPVDLGAQSSVMIDRSQMASNIYNPNSKVLRVSIPDLEIGDVVRYVARADLVKPRVPNTWSEYEVLEYTSPILHFTFEVDGPASRPLQSIAVKAPVEGTVSETREERGDRIVYRWEASAVPRMYPEPEMPDLHTVVQRLLVSTIPDWEAISRWYWTLCEPHFATSPEMEAKVQELTAGLTDREAKIRAIFKFVSQEVRYMGITIEEEAPGYEPHDAKMTFDNRHGVCRDKAALLVAMLRHAGFEAFPVIIHAGPKKDEEVPQPYFNHAVSAVRDPDGSYMLMDSTDENTKRLFPAYLSNKSYLVATPEGDPLRTSPIVPAEENMMSVTTRASLDAKGTLSGESTLDFEGINDNAYRGYFARISVEQRREFFERILRRVSASITLEELEITPQDMLDTETPLRVRVRFTAPDVPVTDGVTTMLPVPRLGTAVGMVNFALGQAGLEERKYPFVVSVACGVRETLTMNVAPELGTIVSMPEFPKIDTPTLFWERHLVRDGASLNGNATFLIRAVEFSPEQYLELRDVLKTLEVNARKRPILRVADDASAVTAETADAVLLDMLSEYDVADAGNWTLTETVRKRVLSYKGKKDNSELSWDYNPSFGSVELVRAAVTTGDTIREISEQEINLMDQGWVAGAPRYPAGKTLVASLPGVEIGSTIEYTVRRTYRDRPLFVMQESFARHDRVRSAVVRLRVPRGFPVQTEVFPAGTAGPSPWWRRSDVIRETRSREGDSVVYEWIAENVPPIKRERDLPPWWSFTPTVWAGSGGWAAYSRELGERLSVDARKDDGVEETLTRLGLSGRRNVDDVVAIRDFVAKNIRAAGPGLGGLPSDSLSPASVTLKDGYGNSPDRAILLHAMLRRAGFSPEFVPVSGAPDCPDLNDPARSFPSVSRFSDVLVRVKVAGRTLWLNDTDQYAYPGTVGHEKCPTLSLASGRFGTADVDDDLLDRTEIDFRVDLTDDGDALIRKESRYFGGDFGSRHKRFAEMPPEERKRFFQETLSALSQSAVAEGDLLTLFDRYPGVERFSARVSDYAIRDGHYLYLDLPATLAYALNLTSEDRENPLYRGGYRRLRIVTDVLLPEGFGHIVLRPQPIEAELPGDGGHIRVRAEETTEAGRPVLRIVHDLELRPSLTPVAAYRTLTELNQGLSHPGAGTVLLSRVEE